MFLNFKNYKGINIFFILFLIINVASVSAQNETPPKLPTIQPTPKIAYPPKPEKNKDWKTKRKVFNEKNTPAEKSIAVDPKVNIQFRVCEGKVRVNGWDKNEIRAFVSDGSEVGFKVRQINRQSNKPILVTVLGFDPAKNEEAESDDCLSGDEIEFDVPRNAVVQITSAESETSIESVRIATVKNVGGNIFLRDISGGIEATTYRGGITVGNSSGTIKLSTDSGNIIALELGSVEIGDIFRAKTNNGTVVLKNVEQRQVEVGSTSGSINFNGEFLNGGQYTFRTQNGSISLSVPAKSSCLVNATYGLGTFYSEIPLQNTKKTNPGGLQNLTGQLGGGEASLNLTTSFGRINIKKQ